MKYTPKDLIVNNQGVVVARLVDTRFRRNSVAYLGIDSAGEYVSFIVTGDDITHTLESQESLAHWNSLPDTPKGLYQDDPIPF